MTKPTATSRLLIHRPPREVFDAFASADTIRKFWLSATSGPLGPGAVVSWEFMVPGAKETTTVTAFESGRRIAFNWSTGMTVDMLFDPYKGDATRVSVTVGELGAGNLVETVADVIEGFTIVMCDLKILLEQGRSANLVRDKAELIASSMKG